MVAARQRKWASYDSHGVPSMSCAALTIIAMYASRSFTRWGARIATTLVNEQKHTTHCSIDVICLSSLDLRCNASARVGSGAPRRWGSNALKSTNSPFQIFSSSLAGTGGELCPTTTPPTKDGASTIGTTEPSGVSPSEPSPDGPALDRLPPSKGVGVARPAGGDNA